MSKDDSQKPVSKRTNRDVWIPVSNLQVGMFVTELDREWLDTPFLMQGFYIRSREDVAEVSKYCQYVWVKGQDRHLFDKPVDFESGVLIGRKPTFYQTTASVEVEHKNVEALVENLTEYVENLLNNVRRGIPIETSRARKVVDECVASVLRHPDVLMWISRFRKEDEYTAEHSINVCALSVIFGRKLGLTVNQLRNLGLCALLHDIGKVCVPDEILNKPGPLLDHETQIMREHADLGRKILLEKRTVYEGAVDVAYCHHERPDGLGYPRGLSGDSISLFSRIISIVDAYDAMTCDRVYAKAISTTDALREIYEQRGKQFDDQLALAFIQTVGLYPPGSIVELINGQIGVVLETIARARRLPKIIILTDTNRKQCPERIVDLSLIESGELSRDYYIKSVLADSSHDADLKEFFSKDFIFAGAKGISEELKDF